MCLSQEGSQQQPGETWGLKRGLRQPVKAGLGCWAAVSSGGRRKKLLLGVPPLNLCARPLSRLVLVEQMRNELRSVEKWGGEARSFPSELMVCGEASQAVLFAPS